MAGMDFSIVQDLVNDLVFDRWDSDKAYEIRAILTDLELSPDLTGLEHPTPVVMERLHRLHKLRHRADQLPGDTSQIYHLLEDDYYKLLRFIQGCYRNML